MQGLAVEVGIMIAQVLEIMEKKITFHSFPVSNVELCQKWLRANPREGYTPTKHSKLCSLHFQPSDFIDEPQDTNASRRRMKSESSVKAFRRYLKEEAVPSIFSNAPKYLSKTCNVPRSTSRATTSSRFQLEEKRLDTLEQSFMENDNISGLTVSQLEERLRAETTLPEDFKICIVEQALLVYLIKVTEDIPKIMGSIIVRSDFTMAVTVDEKVVPSTQYHDLVKGPLRSMSQLVNLMARIKAWIGDPTSRTLEFNIKLAIQHLKTTTDSLEEDSEEHRKKRVEYTRGEMQGLTPDGSVASTLLCFMVKSVVSKYKDIVAIYPMSKLTAAKQHECYLEVAALLRSVFFNVIAIAVDNATTNRKFFIDFLCHGSLETKVIDNITGQPIFLIFDPVHGLKNIYNNFQSRKVFECPPMPQNLPDGCCANFSDIMDLYNLEAAMTLKKAHRVTAKALYPKSIEKTSVKLATSIFSESTRDALRFYGTQDGKSSWTGTADFLALIIKLWNIVNVKTSTKGKHKRDSTMDPVRSSLDWKLNFLRDFASFLQNWEDSKKPGLTRETFLSMRHTCMALVDCSSYLLDRLGFNFVLLGHLQSDAIESRFGWFRQLSGANYYISMRQVLEGDRKIRALSLLKFSGFSLNEIDDAIKSNVSNSNNSAEDATADELAESLQCLRWPSSSDANVIFYVSGAMARSVVHITRCGYCKQELVDPDASQAVQLEEDFIFSHGATKFLDDINRGGLTKPSEYTFMLAVHCWRVFEEINASLPLKSRLLAAECQRSLFVKIMDRVTDIDSLGHPLVSENYCFKGHDLKSLLVQRLFNCFAKNAVKKLTSDANQSNQQPAKRRKIAKLSSASHQ